MNDRIISHLVNTELKYGFRSSTIEKPSDIFPALSSSGLVGFLRNILYHCSKCGEQFWG